MTPEQLNYLTTRLIEENEKSTSGTVKTVINGKLDHLTARVIELQSFMEKHSKEDHDFQERIAPYLEGAAGLGYVTKILISIGGLAIAITAVKNFFKL